MIHSRNQLLLGQSFTSLSVDKNETNGVNLALVISKIEVLRRRNKPSEQCFDQVENWDEFALLRNIQKIGCSPPYLEMNHNFSVCSTRNQMKEWSNMMAVFKNERDYQPCQKTPRIDFNLEQMNQIKDTFMIRIKYPEEVKIVTQSRAVDVNALMGNIGGYIGLFLGIAFRKIIVYLLYSIHYLIFLFIFLSVIY
jgi:hypothetical protein